MLGEGSGLVAKGPLVFLAVQVHSGNSVVVW